ncbi:MAG: glutaredoxin family protein [candidate division Zixibacteria bacterium]|nr:glutaredoxin family protein [candidate division Zixibacteria bacterium]MDH3937427.1 glutaredoxin family protein [candidate division Zixibacteria bacterium]MDH4034565.1 glutaredoxin family protein [candidate division Zixibacteria bacterium]
MSEVIIYTKEGCPYCAAAKKHYTEQGVSFNEIDINVEEGAKDKLLSITKGERIVPVIIEGDDVKLGFGGG